MQIFNDDKENKTYFKLKKFDMAQCVKEAEKKGVDTKEVKAYTVKSYQDQYHLSCPGTDPTDHTNKGGKRMFASSLAFTTNINPATSEYEFLQNNSAIVYF